MSLTNSSFVDILAFSLPSFDLETIFLLKHMIKAMVIEAVSENWTRLHFLITEQNETFYSNIVTIVKGKINCAILIQCKSNEP